MGNFSVGHDVVTSATCEEAHCEAGPNGFVAAAGATRRRMDIKSTIPRPESQQCTIIDVDWNDLFGDCCVSPAAYRKQSPFWENAQLQ